MSHVYFNLNDDIVIHNCLTMIVEYYKIIAICQEVALMLDVGVLTLMIS
jgi:hypothetical protein